MITLLTSTFMLFKALVIMSIIVIILLLKLRMFCNILYHHDPVNISIHYHDDLATRHRIVMIMQLTIMIMLLLVIMTNLLLTIMMILRATLL